ncbi:hypothetical protein PC116_g21643 [Phytophthora cactorum]|nr:hypothetical protein PC116_g21643 [Phytophthora cactorum]
MRTPAASCTASAGRVRSEQLFTVTPPAAHAATV